MIYYIIESVTIKYMLVNSLPQKLTNKNYFLKKYFKLITKEILNSWINSHTNKIITE